MIGILAIFVTGCASGSESVDMRMKAAREKAAREDQERKAALRLRGIPISVSYNTSDPDSAGGVGFETAIENLTAKTIKYVSISAVPYNAVGDKVSCQIRKHSVMQGEITGPIEPDQRSDPKGITNAWYNPTIKCAKITDIRLTYMDGSKQRIKNIESVLVAEQPDCP